MQCLPDLGPADDPGVEELGALLDEVAASPDSLGGRPSVSAQRPVDVLVERARVPTAAVVMAQGGGLRVAGYDPLGQGQGRRIDGARGGIGHASGIGRVWTRGTREATALKDERIAVSDL